MASSELDAGRDLPLPAVLGQMPSGVVVAEAPGGRLLHVNPRVERIWRRSFGDVRGVEDYAAWGAVHPDGRPYRPEEWPLARSLATGEVVEEEDVPVSRGDGTRAVVRLCCGPVRDEAGRIVAAVLTCSDVTEHIRRERVRRLLAESSAALASSLDYQHTLRNVARLVVPTLADWCSIDMAGEGETIERLVVEHAAEAPDAPDAEGGRLPRTLPVDADVGVARSLRSGAAELLPELDEPLLRALAGDGEHLRLLRRLEPRSAMIVPLLARGKTLGAIVLVGAGTRPPYGAQDLEQVRELADRAALAIDNARLYHEAQAANRAKADFLSVISHELRTPLTAIIGYAELLSLGVPEPVTERQREQVERIEVSGRHLLRLIEEILTMASLETGQAVVRHEPVRVGELLQRASVIAGPMVEAKGLELTVEPVEPGLTLRTDPDKLLQVVLTLLSNAMKFTDRGEVRVSARREAEVLEVRVRDTGIGVEPRNRERIFDPFWQAEQPITRRVGGTGLGLAIGRRVMELLGGELLVESAPGSGSTFVIRLPMQP